MSPELQAVGECLDLASGALAEARAGRASYRDLETALQRVSDVASAALAEVSWAPADQLVTLAEPIILT